MNKTERKNRKWNLLFKSINRAKDLKIKRTIKANLQSTEASANVASEILNSWDFVQSVLKVWDKGMSHFSSNTNNSQLSIKRPCSKNSTFATRFKSWNPISMHTKIRWMVMTMVRARFKSALQFKNSFLRSKKNN